MNNLGSYTCGCMTGYRESESGECIGKFTHTIAVLWILHASSHSLCSVPSHLYQIEMNVRPLKRFVRNAQSTHGRTKPCELKCPPYY